MAGDDYDFDDDLDDVDVDAMLNAVAAVEQSLGFSNAQTAQQPRPQQQPATQPVPVAARPSPWNPLQQKQQPQQKQQQQQLLNMFKFKPPQQNPQIPKQNEGPNGSLTVTKRSAGAVQTMLQTSLPWTSGPQTASSSSQEPEMHWTTPHPVDSAQLATYDYPTNYPVRDYQFNIVSRALFSNTLVALPTGLGKTFIAAVVMHNFFRWFPEGKIVFMAPTKPLVAQQIEACFKITGVPQSATHELTGATKSETRESIWTKKRVFFLTPQVLQNDLRSGICPAKSVVLVVVDEAHRAQGDHAYCQVITELTRAGAPFRVLALTATPGSEITAVQRVVDNLLIQHIEIRTEDSLDIRPYIFSRSVETVVVHPTETMTHITGAFSNIVGVYMKRLYQNKVFYEQDPVRASRYTLMMARDRWRQTRGGMNQALVNTLESDFAICMSMCSALQLLQQHGIRSFYNTLSSFIAETLGAQQNKVSRARMQFVSNPDLKSLISYIEKIMVEPTFVSHPKLENLTGVLLKHFSDVQTADDHDDNGVVDGSNSEDVKPQASTSKETRVMIFSQYRESVDEIVEALNKHQPLLRVMSFIGQSAGKKGSSTKGLTQKEQLQVIQRFQSGNYNVLVATSIGEEGLDIGEVDLIVCYDAQTSPIRMLQRMGRTGRKRKGRIVVLLSQGKEEDSHRRAQAQYKSVQRAIVDGQGKKLNMYREGLWRVLPSTAKPVCEKKLFAIPEYKRRKTNSGDLETKSEFGNSVGEDGSASAISGAAKRGGRGKQSRSGLGDDKPLVPGYTRDQMLARDQQMYGHIDPSKTGLDLSRFAHWQTELLSESESFSRTDHSRALVSTIRLCERLAQDEIVGMPCAEVEKMMRDMNWPSLSLDQWRKDRKLSESTLSPQEATVKQSARKRPVIVSLESSENDDDDDFEIVHTTKKRRSTELPAPGPSSRAVHSGAHITDADKQPLTTHNAKTEQTNARSSSTAMSKLVAFKYDRTSLHSSKFAPTSKQPTKQADAEQGSTSHRLIDCVDDHMLDQSIEDFGDDAPWMDVLHASVDDRAQNKMVHRVKMDQESIRSQERLVDRQQQRSASHSAPSPNPIQERNKTVTPDIDADVDCENNVLDHDPVCPWNRQRDLVHPRPLQTDRLAREMVCRLSPYLSIDMILGKIPVRPVIPAASLVSDAGFVFEGVSTEIQVGQPAVGVSSQHDTITVEFDDFDDDFEAELAALPLSPIAHTTSGVKNAYLSTSENAKTESTADHDCVPSSEQIKITAQNPAFVSSSHVASGQSNDSRTTDRSDSTPFIKPVRGNRRRAVIPDLSSPDGVPSVPYCGADAENSNYASFVFKTPIAKKPNRTSSMMSESTSIESKSCTSACINTKNGVHAPDYGCGLDLSTPDSGPVFYKRLRPGRQIIIEEDEVTINKNNRLVNDDIFDAENAFDLDDDGSIMHIGDVQRTPLLGRREMRFLPRPPPRERGTPVLPPRKQEKNALCAGGSENQVSNVVNGDSRPRQCGGMHKRRHEKTEKPARPNPFLDVEAALSSDSNPISSDEASEDGADDENTRRKFVVNDSDMSSQTDPKSTASSVAAPASEMDMHAFYRTSLLSPEQGGLGRRFLGSRFRLANLEKFQKRNEQYADEMDEEIEEEDFMQSEDIDDFEESCDNLQPKQPVQFVQRQQQNASISTTVQSATLMATVAPKVVEMTSGKGRAKFRPALVVSSRAVSSTTLTASHAEPKSNPANEMKRQTPWTAFGHERDASTSVPLSCFELEKHVQ